MTNSGCRIFFFAFCRSDVEVSFGVFSWAHKSMLAVTSSSILGCYLKSLPGQLGLDWIGLERTMAAGEPFRGFLQPPSSQGPWAALVGSHFSSTREKTTAALSQLRQLRSTRSAGQRWRRQHVITRLVSDSILNVQHASEIMTCPPFRRPCSPMCSAFLSN